MQGDDWRINVVREQNILECTMIYSTLLSTITPCSLPQLYVSFCHSLHVMLLLLLSFLLPENLAIPFQLSSRGFSESHLFRFEDFA